MSYERWRKPGPLIEALRYFFFSVAEIHLTLGNYLLCLSVDRFDTYSYIQQTVTGSRSVSQICPEPKDSSSKNDIFFWTVARAI